MAALTVDQVLARAASTLLDELKVRYTATDMVRFLSDAQRRVCVLKPSAYSTTLTIGLIAGTKQTLPGTARRLLNVLCNTDAGGTTPGRSILPIKREVLNAENINWHFKPLGRAIEHFVYEPQLDPTVFYVYPAPSSPSSQYIRCVFALQPPECTVGGALSIEEMWHDVLADYVVARVISRDGEAGNQLQRAQLHMTAFYNGLGMKPPEGGDSAAQ